MQLLNVIATASINQGHEGFSSCTLLADWVLVDAACHAYSMVSVPLYDTLGPEAVSFICGHAELQAIACSPDVLSTLLESLSSKSTVKLVVSCLSPCPALLQGHQSLQWQAKAGVSATFVQDASTDDLLCILDNQWVCRKPLFSFGLHSLRK